MSKKRDKYMKNVRNNQNVNKILENCYKYGENMEKYMKIWQNMCKLYKMYINIQSAANMCIHIYIYIYIYIYTKTEEMCINC